MGRITLSGTVVTGLVQGALAGLGFWMTGVPRPLFLGIAAAIASLVPAVGTLLVWVPAGLYLLAIGSPGAAAAELAWGALVVVGFSDYVIRPRLVGDEGMPAILTFLALFGGLEVLGLPGLIAGPVLMALAVAVLRLYAREVRGGKLNDSTFGRRMRGEGEWADLFSRMFKLHRRRVGMPDEWPELSAADFANVSNTTLSVFPSGFAHRVNVKA